MIVMCVYVHLLYFARFALFDVVQVKGKHNAVVKVVCNSVLWRMIIDKRSYCVVPVLNQQQFGCMF